MSLQRFLPDTWVDGLLRPVLMVEPASMHYFEGIAPDLRWALVLMFLLLGVRVRDATRRLGGLRSAALLTLFVCFYVWTFVAGNGRYFLAGLLAVGPAVFLAARRLPGSAGFRALLLVGGIALHLSALGSVYDNDGWRWARWYEGPGVALEPSPILRHPATFFSLSSNSHSAFVPQVHPASSWVYFRDDIDVENSPSAKRLEALMEDSAKPAYAMIARAKEMAGADGQPGPALRHSVVRGLSRFRLALDGQPCVPLDFPSVGPHPMQFGAAKGFWACPIKRATTGSRTVEAWRPPSEVARAYERMETACPKFFPRDGGKDTPVEEGWLRSYPGTEMRLFVERGVLYYAYYLTLVGTRVAPVVELQAANLPPIDCNRLEGRYRPPWLRD